MPRFPTAILSTGLMLLAFLFAVAGLILDTVTKGRRELKLIAYLAQLMIHRYAMLGILTEEGYPVAHVGILDVPPAERANAGDLKPLAGKKCPECANRTMIRKDGCDFCTACGYTGACG